MPPKIKKQLNIKLIIKNILMLFMALGVFIYTGYYLYGHFGERIEFLKYFNFKINEVEEYKFDINKQKVRQLDLSIYDNKNFSILEYDGIDFTELEKIKKGKKNPFEL